jgi:hypothetical protein
MRCESEKGWIDPFLDPFLSTFEHLSCVLLLNVSGVGVH